MLEDAVDHVGDGLEPAMGMPRRALRFAGRVLDFPHLVEMDERIEVLEVDAGERAPDREPLPLETARRAGHATHGSLAGGGWIRLRDPGQDGDVFDDDGWHVNSTPCDCLLPAYT